jgi:hypothetical protein
VIFSEDDVKKAVEAARRMVIDHLALNWKPVTQDPFAKGFPFEAWSAEGFYKAVLAFARDPEVTTEALREAASK